MKRRAVWRSRRRGKRVAGSGWGKGGGAAWLEWVFEVVSRRAAGVAWGVSDGYRIIRRAHLQPHIQPKYSSQTCFQKSLSPLQTASTSSQLPGPIAATVLDPAAICVLPASKILFVFFSKIKPSQLSFSKRSSIERKGRDNVPWQRSLFPSPVPSSVIIPLRNRLSKQSWDSPRLPIVLEAPGSNRGAIYMLRVLRGSTIIEVLGLKIKKEIVGWEWERRTVPERRLCLCPCLGRCVRARPF